VNIVERTITFVKKYVEDLIIWLIISITIISSLVLLVSCLSSKNTDISLLESAIEKEAIDNWEDALHDTYVAYWFMATEIIVITKDSGTLGKEFAKDEPNPDQELLDIVFAATHMMSEGLKEHSELLIKYRFPPQPKSAVDLAIETAKYREIADLYEEIALYIWAKT
jgi:hypothetical protein